MVGVRPATAWYLPSILMGRVLRICIVSPWATDLSLFPDCVGRVAPCLGSHRAGGSGINGTVFKVNTDGTGFTDLYSFTVTSCDTCPNSDGAYSEADLLLSGNTLY